MKKILLTVAVIGFVITACGKGSLAKDFGDLFEGATKELNSAAAELKSATDGAGVAAALNKVYNTMLTLKTKGAELEKKHGMRAHGAMPPELKGKNEEFQNAIKNVFSSETQAVMQKYTGDPAVLEVMNKIKGLKN